ncbi:MAG: hypothetical protein ACXWVU_00755 [Sulfuricurvum sp.]
MSGRKRKGNNTPRSTKKKNAKTRPKRKAPSAQLDVIIKKLKSMRNGKRKQSLPENIRIKKAKIEHIPRGEAREFEVIVDKDVRSILKKRIKEVVTKKRVIKAIQTSKKPVEESIDEVMAEIFDVDAIAEMIMNEAVLHYAQERIFDELIHAATKEAVSQDAMEEEPDPRRTAYRDPNPDPSDSGSSDPSNPSSMTASTRQTEDSLSTLRRELEDMHLPFDALSALSPEDIAFLEELIQNDLVEDMDVGDAYTKSDVEFYDTYMDWKKALKEIMERLHTEEATTPEQSEQHRALLKEIAVTVSLIRNNQDRLDKIKDSLENSDTRRDDLKEQIQQLRNEIIKVKQRGDNIDEFDNKKINALIERIEVKQALLSTLNQNNPSPHKRIDLTQKDEESEARYYEFEENYNDIRDTLDAVKEQEYQEYRHTLTTYTDIIEKFTFQLFQPFEVDQDYVVYQEDEFKKMFNMFLKMREEMGKHSVKDKKPDIDFVNRMAVQIQEFETILKNNGKQTRDMAEIRKDIATKRQMFKVFTDSEHNKKRLKGFSYHYARADKRIHDDLNTSIRSINAEITIQDIMEYLKNNTDQNFEQAIERLNQDFLQLEQQIIDDPSAYSHNMNQIFEATFNRYKTMIGKVNTQDRKKFEEALEMEKESLRRIISKKVYEQWGLIKATKDVNLQKLIMDPTTFQNIEPKDAIPFTNAGMTIRESRRLMGIMKELSQVRQRMTEEVHKKMNREHDNEAWKFDLICTHVFPPSQVEFKLRYYMKLSNESKNKYKKGVFMKAIKALLPDFDPDKLSKEDFLAKVNEINQSSKSFLQSKTEGTSMSWSDFEEMGNYATRGEAEIVTQLDLDPKATFGDDYKEGGNDIEPGSNPNPNPDPTGNGPKKDQDSFNPSPVGQLLRDQIDDAKRQDYIRMIGSIASTSLEPPQEEAYVPLHPRSAKYFFNGDNYKALQKQFDAQHPIIPKTTVNNPMRLIQSIIKKYGPILGVKKSKTSEADHPGLIQKEAIELNELVSAFSRYTSATTGEFNQDAGPSEEQSKQPQTEAQNQKEEQPTAMQTEETAKTTNQEFINPLSNGEEVSDQYISGASNNSRNDTSWIGGIW